MVESTLRFDDIGVVPGLLPLLWAVQRSHMQSGNKAMFCKQCTILSRIKVAKMINSRVLFYGGHFKPMDPFPLHIDFEALNFTQLPLQLSCVDL